MDFVWRQSRGTRFERQVAVWCLTESTDPIERSLANDQIRPGDSIESVVTTYGPFDVVILGRYHVVRPKSPPGTISFGGWTIIAKDGRVAAATSWSCVYTVEYFNTLTAAERVECDRLFSAELDRRWEARRDARMAVAGFGAITDSVAIPVSPDREGQLVTENPAGE